MCGEHILAYKAQVNSDHSSLIICWLGES